MKSDWIWRFLSGPRFPGKSRASGACFGMPSMCPRNRVPYSRTKWYETIEEMQKDLDEFLISYNTRRAHQGLGMNGRTPYQVFQEGLTVVEETEEATPTEVA